MAKMQLILGLTILLVAVEAALSIPTSQCWPLHVLCLSTHSDLMLIVYLFLLLAKPDSQSIAELMEKRQASDYVAWTVLWISNLYRANEIKSNLPQPTQPGVQSAQPKLPVRSSAAPQVPQPMSNTKKTTEMAELEKDLKIQQNYDSCYSGGKLFQCLWCKVIFSLQNWD